MTDLQPFGALEQQNGLPQMAETGQPAMQVSNDDIDAELARRGLNADGKPLQVEPDEIDRELARRGLDSEGKPLKQEAPSFGQKVAGDFSSRASKINQTLGNKNQEPLSNILQSVGNAAAIPGDIALSALGSAFPETTQDIHGALGQLAGTQTGQSVIGGAQDLAQQYPQGAGNLEALLNIASLAPVGKAATAGKDALRELTSGVPLMGKNIENIPSLGGDLSGLASRIKPVTKVRDFDTISQTTKSLKNNTQAAYQKAADLGATLTKEASSGAGSQIRADVIQEIGSDLDPVLHSQTSAALKLLDKKAEKGLGLLSLENSRKQLGRIAYGKSTAPEDAFAAKAAVKSIDKVTDSLGDNPSMLTSGTPEAITALKAGRAASQLERRHGDIAKIVRDANGDPDKLQTVFNTLYKNQKKFNQYSPDEQAIIKSLAHAGTGTKVLKNVGRVGFGGSSHTIPALETLAAFTNPALGIPMVAGTVANVARKSIVRGSADKLLQTIAKKAK